MSCLRVHSNGAQRRQRHVSALSLHPTVLRRREMRLSSRETLSPRKINGKCDNYDKFEPGQF